MKHDLALNTTIKDITSFLPLNKFSFQFMTCVTYDENDDVILDRMIRYVTAAASILLLFVITKTN